MANRYGFRPVTMLGSFVTCIAFVLSSQASSIEFIYISYGILGKFSKQSSSSSSSLPIDKIYPVAGGIGAGMIYVPAVITTGFYFEKRRAFATGIAVCGSGIGGFLLNPVSEWLIKNYDWDGALLWQAGSYAVFSFELNERRVILLLAWNCEPARPLDFSSKRAYLNALKMQIEWSSLNFHRVCAHQSISNFYFPR